MDGNNSLRQVDPNIVSDHTPLIDMCKACSDLWLTQGEVDMFKDEVKAKAPKKVVAVSISFFISVGCT